MASARSWPPNCTRSSTAGAQRTPNHRPPPNHPTHLPRTIHRSRDTKSVLRLRCVDGRALLVRMICRGWVVRVVMACGLGLCGWAHAEVALAPVFQDRAVLQRDRPIPVWGTAAPGEEGEVVLGVRRVSTTADASGYWAVRFDALTARAEPLEMVARGTNAVTVR